MIEEHEALRKIFDHMDVREMESVALSNALGRRLGKAMTATVALPGFDHSSMDGYAIRSEDGEKGSTLLVTGVQPAGSYESLALDSGEAVRIFTGAPIPKGCDAVVMQEDVQRKGSTITLSESVEKGEFIRRKGGDITPGQRLASRGELLTPELIGVLASQGLKEIPVVSLPKITILTTGDELLPPNTPLAPGQIYNSNGPMLDTLVQALGISPAVVHAKDDSKELRTTLKNALQSDMVVISGGVSVGDRDLVRSALEDLGVETVFWRVRVQPGKPFFFGKHRTCRIFGLPGNPVSTFVTFLLFVKSAFLHSQGVPEEKCVLREMPGISEEEISNSGNRPHYIRGILENGKFSTTSLQQSHALRSLAMANALVRVAPGECLPAGTRLNCRCF